MRQWIVMTFDFRLIGVIDLLNSYTVRALLNRRLVGLWRGTAVRGHPASGRVPRTVQDTRRQLLQRAASLVCWRPDPS